jgi:glycosyltransferase involved in cell wall biosynthesis
MMESFPAASAPKVSVLMVTYNHERYIAQAVESALAQETSFPLEIVIGEDCSTDRTREILLDLQADHPSTMRLLLQEQNLGGTANFAATFAACRGEFIAMLEGDDYWTHPHKLQRQIDALEAHPDWAMCFHITRRVYEDDSREPELIPPDWTKEVATIDDLFKGNFLNTCSLVFRNRLFGPLPAWHQQIAPGDWVLSLLNAAHGLIGCLPEVMADYRIHPQGMWSRKSRAEQLREILKMLTFVDHHFQGKYREQIDAYRLNLVSSLVAEAEFYKGQVPEPVSLPVIVLPPPAPKPRPAGLELVRQVLRPVERAVRHGRAAIGFPVRAA